MIYGLIAIITGVITACVLGTKGIESKKLKAIYYIGVAVIIVVMLVITDFFPSLMEIVRS